MAIWIPILIGSAVGAFFPKNDAPKILFSDGGEVFQELTFYRVFTSSGSGDNELYFGADKKEAEYKFHNTDKDDIGSKYGGIVIFESLINKYKFVQELDEEIGDGIEDYPIEDYHEDSSVYELIEEGEFELVESKNIDPLNEASDKILSDVQDYYRKKYGNYKYNNIEVDNGLDVFDDGYIEYGTIQLRITDHSENVANNDRYSFSKYFISVVIADEDATKNQFLQSVYERRRNEVELYFDSNNDVSEIISEIESAIEEGREYLIEKHT
jgi:hypothetical protein